MREILKFTGVHLTRAGADRGVDVTSNEAIAQVKWYSSPVGIAEVQRLRGSTVQQQWVVFYASIHGYTKSAQTAAVTANVALFKVSQNGSVVPDNPVADSLLRLRSGIPQPRKAGGGLTWNAFMVITRRLWELERAVREYGDRIDKLISARDHMQGVLRRLTDADPDAAAELRQRMPVWPMPDEEDELDDVKYRFSKLSAWHDLFPDGQADPTPVLPYLEEVLTQLPQLMNEAIACVPIGREQINDWCDYWIAERHRQLLEPPKRIPRSRALRERIDRRLNEGPNRSTLEYQAKVLALRVVL